MNKKAGWLERQFKGIKDDINKQTLKNTTRVANASPQLKQAADEFLDLEKTRLKQQDIIKQVLGRGYFDDAFQVLKHGGKLFHAPRRLVPPLAARKMVQIDGRLLNGDRIDLSQFCLSKTTLIGFYFNDFGRGHVSAWMDAIDRLEPQLDTLQVNVQESWIKKPVMFLLGFYIRFHLPIEEWSKHMILYKTLGREIGMDNRALGWVNLVDKKGRIRWQAHGIPTEQELETLQVLTKKLETVKG